MTDAPGTGPLAEGPTMHERGSRLSQGAAALAAGGRRTVVRHPLLLLTVAATLMTVGVAAILLAWYGIARSTMVEQQLAYLVSGGLLGLALATIGGLAFFSHWLTVLIKATREQTELLREVRSAVAQRPAPDDHGKGETDGDARGTTPRRPVRRAPRRS